ncbi:hypothetical protein GOARA_033_00190 [Gordonia araii NBRC 100433]|uniref:Uncharacterized protein n=1 Tax=Gordonia araii NBRC 100433 TaxID=1073574 RepID=G7H043_9ACTN|nr:hypothetical protein [Gordonia araii]NNG99049.1 hypothetical protein [Gordonia araii NBRC 100433]GAB09218.1 hypothetical protein GOARA_033_00190 [Gordonia araii NBRC 100433]
MTTPDGLPNPNGPTWSDRPDVPLRLDGTLFNPAPNENSPTDDLARQIGLQVTMAAPGRWTRLAATFALTSTAEHTVAMYADDQGRAHEFTIPPNVIQMVDEHRRLSAASPDGPWWRLAVSTEHGQDPAVVEDRGAAEPFAPEYVFPPDVYREEFRRYPTIAAPLWLLAHAYHDNRQRRPDVVASAPTTIQVPNRTVDLPDADPMWARWAVLAAVTMATGNVYGAGIQPATAIYEAPGYSGATLLMLPGRHAVLSGGTGENARLARAYRLGDDLPDLYAGAPGWVTDATLNIRAERGQLTFCYWYTDGKWHAAHDAEDLSLAAPALPAVGNNVDVTDSLTRLVGVSPTATTAAQYLVVNAENRTATRAHLETLLPDATYEAISTALNQLQLAGCAS